jgi:hypothetical protein
MANAIKIDNFYFLNPDINKNCINLWLDYNYCMFSLLGNSIP